MIEHGLSSFDMDQVRERWNEDVRGWIAGLVRAWVQRCKSMHFNLEPKGIGIKLETQDDRGYYNYEFDVFPGRKA